MLRKIESKEILSKRDARIKYSDKYFRMIMTEVVDRADGDLGYVIYTADDKRDFLSVDWSEYEGKRLALMEGGAAEPFNSIGGIILYE
jgi:hypothetical protein